MADRIYIVEDHDWLREMLSEYIGQMPGMVVCGAVGSGEEALVGLGSVEADLVLVDLVLPRMSGADVVRQVRASWPALPCLMLSAHAKQEFVDSALAAGAMGYVRKDDPAELERALRSVLVGEPYISRQLVGRPPGELA
jgi:DNA-binding NarL/FixJ family response regulator